ncbi:merozoite surface protein 3, putative [Plasmodium ovale]|uniref:Merozoite surface protein 3 n=2 Tax=Plasmodium ovale TaxID=36330 RepID=A0A1A8WH80_PLAOA|nr:merozoite surface protein 3 [Plasmodium ovale curtisi]SCQ16637.1 merozoite surface protein 3, putative [Plasmodium ovale]
MLAKWEADKEAEAANRATESRIAEKAKEVADIEEDAVKEAKKKEAKASTAKEKAIHASARAFTKSGKSQNWDMSKVIDVSPGESADITHKEENGEYEEEEEVGNSKEKGDIPEGENKDEQKNEKKDAPLNDDNAHESVEEHYKNIKDATREAEELLKRASNLVQVDAEVVNILRG